MSERKRSHFAQHPLYTEALGTKNFDIVIKRIATSYSLISVNRRRKNNRFLFTTVSSLMYVFARMNVFERLKYLTKNNRCLNAQFQVRFNCVPY
jgi:hypothetical protein